MSGNRQVEVHYINTAVPYTRTESFMDLFEGLSYSLTDMFLPDALHDLGNSYWSMMQANSYKYGFSGSVGNSYYSFCQLYELNDLVPRLDGGRRVWENHALSSNQELIPDGPGRAEPSVNPNTEGVLLIMNFLHALQQQYGWQDNIDPDNMTYEELLDLGESVGTQSRGLSQESISLLPVMKYKCSFFLRRKQRERCVICQMHYKRGDQQMTLPCKHVYHSGCVSRWLGLNKACPICFAEVANNEPN
ncbi:E3 ubiquitin ligase BIG BROTHER [Platanthera zijinensis]|uniref:E3 ubiquitin ligase BIG BROTHER n=1 Tax=Platanthera zijinensis TaxID=2320716 RepID=A0AAP0B9T5_9ASPA